VGGGGAVLIDVGNDTTSKERTETREARVRGKRQFADCTPLDTTHKQGIGLGSDLRHCSLLPVKLK